MGCDPPTHQVWVKITGLPLQAWTAQQITVVLQKFGHPIQILPFGQAAGHYRNVTALVATLNPNRIPMAYTYREGNYSTRIDIRILNWRLSEQGYFPPPENPQTPQNQGNWPQQNNNPVDPRDRQSSPSSDEAPSEPTIDLSSWSPRSHSIRPFSASKWVAKSKQQSQLTQTQLEKSPTAIAGTPPICLALTTTKLSYMFLVTKNPNGPIAVANPADQLNLTKIFPLRAVSLLIVPSSIVITPLSTLQTICVRKRRETRDRFINVTRSSLPVVAYGNKQNPTDGDISCTPTSICLTAHSNKYRKLEDGQTQPKANVMLIILSPNIQAQMQAQIRAFPRPPPLLTQARAPLSHPYPQSLFLSFPSPPSAPPQTNISCLLGSPTHLPQESQKDTISPTMSSELLTDNESQHDPPLASDSLTEMTLQIASVPTPPPVRARTQRATQQPTRRSRRLQDRSQPSSSAPKSLTKPKGRTVKIPFNLGPNLAPLDENKTMQILQATGLQITEQIKQMMDEAIKQDRLAEANDTDAPSTPLHDLIPPLEIPGEDMLL